MCVIAIAVGECLGELVQKFPVYNAINVYVRVFVDPDLAWVTSIAYWYAYASIFANQSLAAASLAGYWGLSKTWQAVVFYTLVPITLTIINLAGVFWYGLIETIGGLLKIFLVVGVSIFLYYIAGKDGNDYITEGVHHDARYVSDSVSAICYCFPIIAYGFLGIEIIGLTAYETIDPKNLKWPARSVAIFTCIIYLMVTIGESLNVHWTDQNLPAIYSGIGASDIAAPQDPPSSSIVIRATYYAGYKTMASFLNGCLIFSSMSAANTSLYVASRTLFGMTQELRMAGAQNWFTRRLRVLAKTNGRKVPVPAILFSFISFLWLPYLQLIKGYPIQEFIQIISISGSVAVVMVWASVCLAYIRYKQWLNICKTGITNDAPEYLRSHADYNASTFLSLGQPALAYIGLFGCILILAFASTTWWETRANFGKVASAYAAVIICFIVYILIKLFSRPFSHFIRPWTWFRHLDADTAVFLDEMQRLKNNRTRPRQREDEAVQPTEAETTHYSKDHLTVTSPGGTGSFNDRPSSGDTYGPPPTQSSVDRRPPAVYFDR
ncbi:hypothetical protein BT63DRAFT_207132 [Microthyrium microscopicum]|uniref:Amino acid permease/ SLC12A domain-containing protein n=1 Tax=Microthyrium microscopicum TaxID=703497 RepID=A0A6A6UJK4_9PEZI|nr:hypothetical protein BT63DRAFT_207132 [Microthyrium microscopicum]